MDKAQLEKKVNFLMDCGQQSEAIQIIKNSLDVDLNKVYSVDEAHDLIVDSIRKEVNKKPFNQTKVNLMLDRLQEVNDSRFTTDYLVRTDITDFFFVDLKGYHLIDAIELVTKEF